jgi:hypothetical protein
MWTPKRVLLLLAGLAVFLTGYEVYAHFLGGIDGLPPLPAAYLADPTRQHLDLPPPKESDADRKLRQAFGLECDEVKRPIKLDVRSRRMVLATTQVKVDEPDGRVKLIDFSLAIWSDQAGDATYPEINTIRGKEAYLTLDRPVSNPMEMANRKIVACELRGSPDRYITIINNRRTPQKHDDIEVRVLTEPLFFDEKQNKIWTAGYVELIDTQTKPEPTTIRAKGLDLHLVRDSGKPPPPPGPTAPRPKGDTVSGVESVVLRSNVEMHLFVDAGSGFLSAGEKAPKPKDGASGAKAAARPAAEGAKAAPADKSHVVIRTQGPFTYQVAKDLASFDSPPANANPAAGDFDLGDQVQVTRERLRPEVTAEGLASTVGHAGMALEFGALAPARWLAGGQHLAEAKLYDTLVCDHLELQFRRKGNPDRRPAGDDQSSEREIESAHAVARPGRQVELSSEAERLEAVGSDFFYYCATAARGPQTVLKGQPLNAIKDRNYNRARELMLVGADPKGTGQALAKGPGQIDLFDRNNPKDPYPLHAVWRDTLTVTKDRDGDRVYDLLTLTGDAAFIDEEHAQDLSAQRLLVWLEPPDRAAAPDVSAQKQTPAELPRQRPHKLEAFEHVKTRSADLIVHDTDHLIVRFKDAPPGEQRLPDALPPAGAVPVPATPPAAAAQAVTGGAQPGAAATGSGPSSPALPAKAPAAAAARPAPFVASSEQAPAAKPAEKPIELWGHSVAAYVLRAGAKNELQEFVTEGAVHVHQEGSGPEDKGVDIKGETLNLVHHPQGDVLIVFGDSRGPAELRFGEMFLSGPKVTINQRENTAEVDGVGVLNMPSNTAMEGGKPAKLGARLTVHWNQYMFFEGKVASFHGGVVAYQEQENSWLRCKALEVTLDRVVSFKEGQKGGQQAKVEKLVGSLDVYAVDTTRDPKGKLVRYQRLVARGVETDNVDGRSTASGPGQVKMLQQGSAEDALAAPGPATPQPGTPKAKPPAPAASDQLNLTRIDFGGRMFSTTNNTKDRTTRFYDNVEVYHQPADNPDVKVDPDHPPKGGMYLRCNLLTVLTRALPDGKTTQFMHAERSVSFRTPDFYGTADIVKYDQSKEQVIFEGANGNLAVIYRFVPGQGAGANTGTVRARQILYERKTGRFYSEGGKEIIWR